jgi:subtilisin family serine protease
MNGSGNVMSVRTAGQTVEGTIENLKRLGSVEKVEPDYTYQASALPNDPDVAKQWYLQAVHLPDAWEFSKGSPTVVIAVLDSGVDLTHPDLRDRIWTNPEEIAGNGLDDDHNGYIDDAHGWDFVDNDNDPNPVLTADGSPEGINHGTLVAGVAAAAGNNAEGGAGAAWNVRIMPLRVLDSRGTGSTLAVVNAVKYAVLNGARIINISFAGPGYSQILASTLRDAARSGVVIVAAAGNEGDTVQGGNLDVRPAYPVCYRGVGNEPIVIGVAAVAANGKRSSFTSYGADCISLSAPGENFYLPQVYRPGVKGFEAAYGGGWSGSSLSAPLVSGTVALLLSMNPGLSPAEVQTLLTRWADPLGNLNPGSGATLGAGLLDAGASVAAAQMALLSGGVIAERPVNLATSIITGYQPQPTFVVAPGSQVRAAALVLNQDFRDFTGFETYARRVSAPPSIAMADLDGDGEPSIIVGAPAGETPTIRIFTKDGLLAAQFLAFDGSYRGGVNVAVGDVNGDGREEIVAVPASAAAPRVRWFDGTGKLLGEILAGTAKERVGLRLAVLDLNGDGLGEVIVAPTDASSRQVRAYGTDGQLKLFFEPFSRAYRGGFELATGDLNGDGTDELVVAAGAGGPPRVSVFNRLGVQTYSFLAYDGKTTAGLMVGVASNGGSEGRILVGRLGSGEMRRYTQDGTLEKVGTPYGPSFRGGLRPAGFGLPPVKK